jgi:hypothetical protein
MCGILGIQFVNKSRPDKAREFIEHLLLQSKIRGLHATGAAATVGEEIRVLKAALPAQKFLRMPEWAAFCDPLPASMILHTRYSTSGDWHNAQNNQPLLTENLALVHNGIVSMGTKGEMEQAYAVQLRAENDSEIILRNIEHHLTQGLNVPASIYAGLHDVHRVQPPIFACGLLFRTEEMYCFRDHVRPLYMFELPTLKLKGFCSTQDIFRRALQSASLQGAKYALHRCEPYVVYNLGSREKFPMSFRYPDDHKYTRPVGLNAGVDKKLLPTDARAPAAYLGLSPPMAIDFRKARRDGFILWYAAQVLTDIDPAFPTLDEIFDRYELSLKQQYWVAFLYAVFYENATVFLVMQEFPELEKVDVGRVQRWHEKNWTLLQYQTDRRWNKGHLVEMVKSYKELIGNQTQHQFFSALMVPYDPTASFNNCWAELHKVYKMGRHSVYAWTETLMRCLGLPIRCPSFYMDIAESSRNGLCYALDRDDLVTKHDKKLSDGARISKAEIAYLEGELDRLMADIHVCFPKIPVDYMYLETATCSYKGLHRRRRYLGYYLDRMAKEIRRGETKMAAISTGVNWDTLWQIRAEVFIPEFLGVRQMPPWLDIRHELCEVFLNTGQLINLAPLKKRGLINIASCLSAGTYASFTAEPGRSA